MKNFKGVLLAFISSLIFTAVFYPFPAHAIFIDDFLVNSDQQQYNDDFPSVLVDSKGNFSVTWTKYCYDPTKPPNLSYSCGQAYLKRYDSSGNVILQATPLTPDSMLVLGPACAVLLPSGNLVVTWTDYKPQFSEPPDYSHLHNYAQIYDSLGQPLIGPFRVDFGYGDNFLWFVTDIDADSLGNFLVLWTGPNQGAYGQHFSKDGMPIGSPFKADTCFTLDCLQAQDPFLAMHPDGHFVITWDEDIREFNSFCFPLGRLYDTVGVPVWDEAKVLSCDSGGSVPKCGGSNPNCLAGDWTGVAMNLSGNFAIFFASCGADQYSNYVYGRLFDSEGKPLTSNFIVSSDTTKTYDVYPKARLDQMGGFFAIWSDSRNSDDGLAHDIFVQRYDSLANPIGSNWRVNTPRGSAIFSEVSFDIASSTDKAFIVWKDYRDWKTYPSWDDSIRTNIYGQLVDLSQVGFYIAGDLNFDGSLTLADLIWLINYVFKGGPPPEPELWIGDANADCKVNLTDIIYYVNYVFKGGSAPQTGCA